MRRHTCDPLAAPRREIPLLQALREALEADRAQLRHCQQGEHDMLATPTPGVAVAGCATRGVPVAWLEPAPWELHRRLPQACRLRALASRPADAHAEQR